VAPVRFFSRAAIIRTRLPGTQNFGTQSFADLDVTRRIMNETYGKMAACRLPIFLLKHKQRQPGAFD
jgi:hypothetical protein